MEISGLELIGGASRLSKDGKDFTNYSTAQGLPGNEIDGILEDKSGNLWFGTIGGVSRYDGKSFKNYTTAQGLSDDNGGSIVIDKEGIIWFDTNKGFTALKGFAQDTKHTLVSGKNVNLQPSNELSNSELESNNFKPVFEIYNNKTGYLVKTRLPTCA